MKPNSQHSAVPFASWFAVILMTFVCSGATCMPRRTIPEFQPRPVFQTTPTVEQLADILSRSRNIQSLQCNSVNINPNQQRNMSANMSWVRERRFRMTGGVSRLLGSNFDVGSNDQLFWLTLRDGSTPHLFYANHDEFDAQVNRRILPISPLWLIEAMGVSELDPYKITQQPSTRADGMIEITTYVPSPIGNFTRTLVVDPKFGYTRQLNLRDPSGRLVANATQSNHEYYPSVEMSLPHRVLVQLIPVGDPPLELDITIGKYLVNSLDPNNTAEFETPNTNGFEVVNLVALDQGIERAVTPAPVSPPQTGPAVSYRGVQWDGTIRR